MRDERDLLKAAECVLRVRRELEAAADRAAARIRAELQPAIDAAVEQSSLNVERLARRIVTDPGLSAEAVVVEALARVGAADRARGPLVGGA